MQQLSLPLSLHPGRGFDDFWVHEKNAELVYQLTQEPVQPRPFSLFFWGRALSGKTHLLEALCGQSYEYGLRAGYVDFNEIDSLSTDVLDGLEMLDLVCLDNLHALNHQCYRHFQLAVFRLFNDMRTLEKSIVIACANSAQDLPEVLPDLTSRLQWGLCYQLHGFQLDNRSFLQWVAQRRGMLLPDASADYILRYHARDPKALLVLLDQLDRISLLEQRKLTIPFVRKIMEISTSPKDSSS